MEALFQKKQKTKQNSRGWGGEELGEGGERQADRMKSLGNSLSTSGSCLNLPSGEITGSASMPKSTLKECSSSSLLVVSLWLSGIIEK